MLVLGVSLSHDASAALLSEGKIVAAIEEERLNRMKHWDAVPVNAIRSCLDAAGVGLSDVDVVAIAGAEAFLDARVQRRLRERRAPHDGRFKEYFRALLERELGGDVRDKLRFFDHHLCHAFSAYATSGFEDALLVSLDGAGDGRSGAAYSIIGDDATELLSVPLESSLGYLYSDITEYIGYKLFDEYKVMGLAPYGNPARYRKCFERGLSLRDDGTFTIDRRRILDSIAEELSPRQGRAEDIEAYRDLAASLQETFEATSFHLFAALKRRTEHRLLCYAGGVAHNCAFNGKLLSSGMFDRIYVQPAADDSGLSIGAACLAVVEVDGWNPERRPDVFLGPPAAVGAAARASIDAWPCLAVHESSNVEREVAHLLADGLAIGWVQGRSEFGPRALGNRSILADPRPAENKRRINDLIKRREGYRPFAPAVLAEATAEYFELPTEQRDFSTMSFVLRVQPSKQTLLGAVTHVDGTARVQTVSHDDNPVFWRLLREFGEITGVPVLLNTSFNNHREPIVDSVDDALASFLTTRLDALVVGSLVVRKSRDDLAWLADMHVARRPLTSLRRDARGFHSASQHRSLPDRDISRELFMLLLDADGSTKIARLSEQAGVEPSPQLLAEIHDLWSERHIEIAPVPIKRSRYWRTSFDEDWF